MASVNVFILASDNSPKLIPLLEQNPALASAQDEHGYSLIHAAASYNHFDLLRALVNDYHVDVNLKDEDGETALFFAETTECAKILVEELHADTTVRGIEGKTAREKVSEDNDFPEVALYLRIKDLELQVQREGTDKTRIQKDSINETTDAIHPPPPLPEGISVDFGTMAPEDAGEVVDSEFRRKIEDLASRDDFQGVHGQEALRALIEEVVRGEFVADVNPDRGVRQRTS